MLGRENWRSQKEIRDCQKNKGLQAPGRDTRLGRGAKKINGLPNGSGHKPTARFGDLIKPTHKRMSRVLGYSLTLGDAEGWAVFSKVAALRLSDEERAALAYAVLNSLSPEQAALVAAASMRRASVPLPAFLGGMEDARYWAALASRCELKAYALAAYDAMSAKDQAAFFRHIGEVEIAA
ncbi:hypothetical protein [Pseudodonghicola flavimaris]|uniref:DUF2336 domain-containing protein n=1 Tax=Pseudodonghicola flavimaris TaxID=3050036 RepID=A0ABT7F4U3_9RHOB|nr:hypothetical protein [Pseudodonghicola flavimaris]MDK3019633.1 hypothetical protein [Pseudodonghicola flavimaris]